MTTEECLEEMTYLVILRVKIQRTRSVFIFLLLYFETSRLMRIQVVSHYNPIYITPHVIEVYYTLRYL